jgi:hypothetical protein
VTGKIVLGVSTRWEPCDVAGLVVDEIGKVHGDGVGMLQLGRLLMGSLLYAQNANPGVVDFYLALRRDGQDDQTQTKTKTQTSKHTVIIKGEEAF